MKDDERLLLVQLREELDIVWKTGEQDGSLLVGLAEQLARRPVAEVHLCLS